MWPGIKWVIGNIPCRTTGVRHLYEDRERQLWVAIDGSISRYDREPPVRPL